MTAILKSTAMKFIVNHDPSEYVSISIRFWIARLHARITKQRKSLSIYLLVAFMILYMINPILGIGLLTITAVIILIDFIATINEAFLEKNKNKSLH
jgi:cell division protein FtsW (lipid II flippase)